MKVVASVALALLVALGFPVQAGAAEAHPGVGVVFDVRTFSDGPDGGGLDDRFEGGPSFPGCEIDNTATSAAQNLTILATDTCKTHTNGAPGPGLVPMSRTFAASAGESYLSWAYARVVNPKGQFVARVRLYARNGSGVLRICGGGGSAIGNETPDYMRLGTGVCTLPQGSTAVTVEFAAEAKAAGAAGRAVLNRIQLLHCADASASCPTTVPTTAPPTTAPPPAPTTTVAPPVTTVDGGGGVVEDPGSVTVPEPTTLQPEITLLPSTTTTTRHGDSETLSPIAGERQDHGGGGGTFWLVFGLLAVAVAAGTAAGWWAWARPARRDG